MPENTVCVTRPGKYGNPFVIGKVYEFEGERTLMTPELAVEYFREMIEIDRKNYPLYFSAYIREIRGKNLACWCKPGDPCHADVLLEIANQTEP